MTQTITSWGLGLSINLLQNTYVTFTKTQRYTNLTHFFCSAVLELISTYINVLLLNYIHIYMFSPNVLYNWLAEKDFKTLTNMSLDIRKYINHILVVFFLAKQLIKKKWTPTQLRRALVTLNSLSKWFVWYVWIANTHQLRGK